MQDLLALIPKEHVISVESSYILLRIAYSMVFNVIFANNGGIIKIIARFKAKGHRVLSQWYKARGEITHDHHVLASDHRHNRAYKDMP